MYISIMRTNTSLTVSATPVDPVCAIVDSEGANTDSSDFSEDTESDTDSDGDCSGRERDIGRRRMKGESGST